jgi:hypothetical protein
VAKKYSADEKATALATLQANGGNVQLTASLLRIPRKTLESWSKGGGMKNTPIPEGLVEEKSNLLAEGLDKVATLLVGELSNPDKVAKASLKDIAISLGIAVDKRNLLRHQPTSITARLDNNLKTQYERMLTKLIEGSASNGTPIDRAEGIDLMMLHLPDFKSVLGEKENETDSIH